MGHQDDVAGTVGEPSWCAAPMGRVQHRLDEEMTIGHFTVIIEECRPGEVILTVAELHLLVRGNSIEGAVGRLQAALR